MVYGILNEIFLWLDGIFASNLVHKVTVYFSKVRQFQSHNNVPSIARRLAIHKQQDQSGEEEHYQGNMSCEFCESLLSIECITLKSPKQNSDFRREYNAFVEHQLHACSTLRNDKI